jgi:hypothetical protein
MFCQHFRWLQGNNFTNHFVTVFASEPNLVPTFLGESELAAGVVSSTTSLDVTGLCGDLVCSFFFFFDEDSPTMINNEHKVKLSKIPSKLLNLDA